MGLDASGQIRFTMLTRVRRRASRQGRLLPSAVAALALFSGAAQAAGADNTSPAKAAIAERLHRWMAAFNAKDLDAVFSLFAADLGYTADDIQNGSRDRLCANLHLSLTSRSAVPKP